MADSVSGGANKSPKEMSMEVRLLLAFLLMGVVMFVTPYLFKQQTPPNQKKTEQTNPAPAPAQQSAAAPVVPAAATNPPPTPAAEGSSSVPATAQQPQPVVMIDTDKFRVVFNNQGATVRSWLLKSYKGNDNKPLELVNTAAALEFPFSLFFP